MLDDASRAAILRATLRDFYVPRRTVAALVKSVCPDCRRELEAIDTWERACPDPSCGYTFNYYRWPWVTATLSPEDPKAPS